MYFLIQPRQPRIALVLIEIWLQIGDRSKISCASVINQADTNFLYGE